MNLEKLYENSMQPTDSILKYNNVKSIMLKESKIINPKISIMIPTYKRANLLFEAINSALNQQGINDYEVIVVDNEPIFNEETETQKTINKISSEKLGYYKNEQNLGMFGNWNRCFQLARAPCVCLLHDDDLLHDDYLINTRKFINLSGKAICIKYKILKKNSEVLNIEKRSIIKNNLKKLINGKTIVKHLSNYLFDHDVMFCMYNRDNVIKLGGFREEFYPNADYVFIALYQKYYGTILINKMLADYRILENESLKHEVLKRFVVQDYFLHQSIINEYENKILKYIFKKYNRAKCYYYLKELNDSWNKNMKIGEIKEIFNLEIDIKRMDKFIYVVLQNIFKIKIKFKLLFSIIKV
jgi:glycosyltransferase involved in cell wall biosynthesis